MADTILFEENNVVGLSLTKLAKILDGETPYLGRESTLILQARLASEALLRPKQFGVQSG